ncbi:hypothetical protein [Desulfobacula sp.]|uniref:Uncharacterized protein n=1 Tax=Candidatus Desulfatibia vada TaxID=2841696 RepID=A0A8J6P2Y5_9BACT|nr:hypothetical protein [Candidatus Desulfatibia vada]MBL6994176.1 hypothetical protein [Desulfobacula sp.]
MEKSEELNRLSEEFVLRVAIDRRKIPGVGELLKKPKTYSSLNRKEGGD